MRTTLNIDDELIKEAKIAAIRQGITLTEYIERALRACGSQPLSDAPEEPWTFPTFPGEPTPGFPWSGSYSKMIEFLEGPEDESKELRALEPFPTREGKPLRDFDWADSSALIEELEGPDARS
jgi:hypothetical protein